VDGDIRSPSVDLKGPFDLIMLFNVIYYFPPEERPTLLKRLHSMLSPDGAIVTAMHFSSHGKDMGAANLNLVNSSVKGLTPLPDLDETIILFREAGLSKTVLRRLLPATSFHGIVASRG
jgi:cyclopropane fatty-acyl-phospholipid synthase-like methyltransferase